MPPPDSAIQTVKSDETIYPELLFMDFVPIKTPISLLADNAEISISDAMVALSDRFPISLFFLFPSNFKELVSVGAMLIVYGRLYQVVALPGCVHGLAAQCHLIRRLSEGSAVLQ